MTSNLKELDVSVFLAKSGFVTGIAMTCMAGAIVLGTALTPVAAAPAPSGDAAKGKQIFARCGICHSTAAGVNKIGPSLNGIVGRKSATISTFNYSPAMASAKLVWTPETLDRYLTNPKALVPGNKMIFPGLPNADDRNNVIAYLSNPDAVK